MLWTNVDKTLLEKLLKKFTFINEFKFNCIIDGEVLQMICNYCQHLRKISFNGLGNTSEEQLIRFGIKCGNNLQVIEFYHNFDIIKTLFAFTPNVKFLVLDIFGYYYKNELNFGEQVFTKLETIHIKVYDLQSFIAFTDKYHNYIKVYIYKLITNIFIIINMKEV